MAYTEIDDPSAYFQTALHTGNGGTQSITNDGNSDLQPDWVWIKGRSTNSHHALFDSVRGATKRISASEANAETTESTGLTSFNSDGWSTGAWSATNSNTKTYVSWQWKAGGSASSNTDGSTTTSVSASTTAGFSIVKWTGDGGATTLGHGLGAVPKMIMVKTLDRSENWIVYHVGNDASAPEDKSIRLDGTNAVQDNNTHFNDTAPTSSVFSVGASNGVNPDGEDQIAYCFSEVKGYSKFGSYTGNGNADGTFVYLGFKPAWVMIKRTNATNNWHINDNKRDTFNVVDAVLYANTDNTEATDTTEDFLSNGFKLRTAVNFANGSGDSYIFMAFAESPFVTSTGVPATAR